MREKMERSRRSRKFTTLRTHVGVSRSNGYTREAHKSSRCTECGKLMRISELEKHMKTHEGNGAAKPYSCEKCKKSFGTKVSLLKHDLTHENETWHECFICHTKIFGENEFTKHMTTHQRKPPTPTPVTPKKQPPPTPTTKQEKIVKAEEKESKKENSEETSKSKEKERKVNVENENEQSQSGANKTRNQQKGEGVLNAIRRKYHLPVKKTTSNHEQASFPCRFCDQQFSSLRFHTRHIMIHHKGQHPYTCTLCNKTFLRSSSLKQHATYHSQERPYKCHLCDASFRYHSNLYSHRFTHKEYGILYCKMCNKNFKHFSTLWSHLEKHRIEMGIGRKEWKFSEYNTLAQTPDGADGIVIPKQEPELEPDLDPELETDNEPMSMKMRPMRLEEMEEYSTPTFGFENNFGLIENFQEVQAAAAASAAQVQADRIMKQQQKQKQILDFQKLELQDFPQIQDFKPKPLKTYSNRSSISISRVKPLPQLPQLLQQKEKAPPVTVTLLRNLPPPAATTTGNSTAKIQEHKPRTSTELPTKLKIKSEFKISDSPSSTISKPTNSSPEITMCPICYKSFPLNHLQFHLQIHTKSQKLFDCQYCGKGFTKNFEKVQHENLHTGHRPYSCADCGNTFRYKSNWCRHRKNLRVNGKCSSRMGGYYSRGGSDEFDNYENPEEDYDNTEEEEFDDGVKPAWEMLQFGATERDQEEQNFEMSESPDEKEKQSTTIENGNGNGNDQVNGESSSSSSLKFNFNLPDLIIEDVEDEEAEAEGWSDWGQSQNDEMYDEDYDEGDYYPDYLTPETFMDTADSSSSPPRTYGSGVGVGVTASAAATRFICNICQKSFQSNYHLAFHKRQHKTNGNGHSSNNARDRRVQCKICYKTFAHRFSLKQHGLVHTGEMPFSCELCDKKFRFKSNFTKHNRQHHPELVINY